MKKTEKRSILQAFRDISAIRQTMKHEPEAILLAVRECAEEGISLPREWKEAISERGKEPFPMDADTIREEMTRILVSNHPGAIRYLQETDVLRRFFPELAVTFSMAQKNPHHVYSVGEHILHVVEGVRGVPNLRWAALLHDLGKVRTHTVDMYGTDHFHGHEEVSARIADSVLHRWKFPKEIREEIVTLVRYHDIRPSREEIPDWIRKLGKERFLLLLELKEADALAQSEYMREQKLQSIQKMRRMAEEF